MKKIYLTLFALLIASNAYAVDRIMPLGDSITRGTGDNGASGLFGYRDHLQTLLGVGTYDFVGTYTDPDSDATFDVDHSGVGGNRCSTVEARTLGELTTHMPTGTNGSNSFVLLMCGMNDVDTDCATGNCSQSEIDAYVQNVIDTVNIINTHDPLINVIVAKINYKWTTSGNADWIQFNDTLATAITTRQGTKSNLYIVDMATPFLDTAICSPNRDACLDDEVHPNNLGYSQIMAPAWYAAIVASNAEDVHADRNYYISPSGLGDMSGTTRENAYSLSGGGFSTALTDAECGDHIIFIEGYGNFTIGTIMTVNKSGCLETAKTFTVVAATDIFTSTSHGYSNGDLVTLSTTSALPSFSYRDEFGLTVANFDSTRMGYQAEDYFSYIVSDVTANTFMLRNYEDGPVIDVTDTGTGTHSVARSKPIYIEGQGFGEGETVLVANRDIPESQNRYSSGRVGFTFSAGVSDIKISNLRLERVLEGFRAHSYENNRIYIQDVYVKHARETVVARGYKSCYQTRSDYNCLEGSHGWIIDNLDADYITKHHIRNEMGWHDSTIANSDVDGRYISADFNLGTHFGTGPSSFNYWINYYQGTGTAPTEGATVTGATSGSARVIRGHSPNEVLGGGVGGIIQVPSGGAYTVDEIITDGTGFSAKVFSSGTQSNSTLGHTFLVYNSDAKHNIQNQDDNYDNGDGFVSETSSHDVIYIGCGSYDNFDGGWDLKGWDHKIINGRCARDGNRCIRLWNGPHYVTNSIIAWTGQGDITQYATGSNASFWIGGIVNYDRVSSINASPLATIESKNFTITYTGGTGGLPVPPHSVYGQATGNFARIAGYAGDASSGTLYVASTGGLTAGEIIAGDGFSATVATVSSGVACSPYSVTNSLIYQDINHQANNTSWTGSACASSITESGNIVCVENGSCPIDPQLVNVYDKYWEGENNSFNPTSSAVVGIYGGYLPVSEPVVHTRTIGGSATIGQ